MRQESSPKAVVLLSGGVDSTTCLAVAKKEGFDLYALSFFYHQRHGVEIEAARRVATAFRVKEHLVLDLPLNRIGGSALTDAIEVPKDTPGAAMEVGIPVTYVPARNTIFLSLALGWAEVLGAADLFIGVNAVDYSGYPDCRPEFIRAFEAMANLALKATVEQRMTMRIHTPLMHLSKARIIRYGAELGVDYSLTHSCYDPDPRGRACGRCDSCVLRSRGFREAGIPDPAAAG
ncbi:MAG TPA: 7-cyano-7-deazaguanine synthase QueC [Syntrophobacteraceae bacterium]|nr:7-cyano-7-deazaguanine synthase QueC [Syntrophobacteraceae bacterium]